MVGRAGRAEVRQTVRYDPFFSLGAVFSDLQVDPESQPVEGNPTTGISDSRSWMSDTVVSVSQRFGRRAEVQAEYGFNKRDYEKSVGFDNRTHHGGFTYDHSLSRSSGLRASYRHTNVRSLDFSNQPIPLRTNTADLGFRHRLDRSTTRRIVLSAGGGPVHVDTSNELTRQNITYWAPSAYADAQVDFGRSWSVLANYRRAPAVLQGLTPQVFLTDAGTVSIGGFVAPRVEATAAAASSSGHAGIQDDVAGRFRSYEMAGQVRVSVTKWGSAVVNYTRYQYTLNETAGRALGVAQEMDRNAVRIGFSVTLPLVGGR